MKNKILFLIPILLIAVSCSQKSIDFDMEKAAIFETFKAEKEGFKSKNMDLMKQNILTDSSYVFINTDQSSSTIRRGFSDQEKAITSYWEYVGDSVQEIKNDFEITDIKIYPNSAWVAITNEWKTAEGKPARNGFDLETIFMEKIDGKWKISSHQFVGYDLTIYSIGLIGTSLPGGWNNSVELTMSSETSGLWEGTFDLGDGEVKFRANNEWLRNWGGEDFPSGDIVTDGSNIKVPKGRYMVSINLDTQRYSFTKVK